MTWHRRRRHECEPGPAYTRPIGTVWTCDCGRQWRVVRLANPYGWSDPAWRRRWRTRDEE